MRVFLVGLCVLIISAAHAGPASATGPPFEATVTVIDGDNRPDTTPGPGRRKGGVLALDANFRSLFVEFVSTPTVSRITLKCNPAVAEIPIDNKNLNRDNLELYSSQNNRTFEKQDFSFSAPDKTTIILDDFQVKAKYLKIHTTCDESADYRFINDLGRMTPTFIRPREKKVTRLEVNDPWSREMVAGKTPAISLKVFTDVPEKDRSRGTLVVRFNADLTGHEVAVREIPNPPAEKKLLFSADDLDWGAYTVRTSFRTGEGEELVGAQGTATVLPGGKQQIKVLNNFVSELLSLWDRGTAGQTPIEFMNPRWGWCFFSIFGDGAVRLNNEVQPLLDGHTSESMRLLPAGRHTLHVEGSPSNLIVRAIPVLQYVGYNNKPYIKPHGPYDWEFLEADVLPNINVMISHGYQEILPELEAWKKSGRSWIAMTPNPFRGRQDVSAAEAYNQWSASVGLNHPFLDGVIVDEFGGGDQLKYDGFREAVQKIQSIPRFKGKTYSPYTYGSSILSNVRSRQFARAAIESGGYICLERYLWEEPTLGAAQHNIRERLLSGWNIPRFEEALPGVTRRTIMVLGYLSAPTESLNINSRVDFKVYMDMQMRMLATEPAFFGLGGVQQYLAAYSDEETIRWAGRLFRHYCIEGNTKPVTNDPYELTHIRNPDFADATDGWEIKPAETGSIVARKLDGYGAFQFRYPAPPAPVIGDTFLWTKRSGKKPNVFSQQIKGLEPGRLYSLKMVTGDYQDLVGEIQDRELHEISIDIDNGEVLPGKKDAFQFIFGNHPSHRFGKFHHLGNYGGNYTYWMNYHWRVFQAKATTVRLSVSDWKSEDAPGGPVGQELIYNFIEVQPYYRR